jgi:hypothetical protein
MNNRIVHGTKNIGHVEGCEKIWGGNSIWFDKH